MLVFLLFFYSCSGNKQPNTNEESLIHEQGLVKDYSLGDFALTIPEGAVARQKMIPTPRFLQARFVEIGIIPPGRIQITFWMNEKTIVIETGATRFFFFMKGKENRYSKTSYLKP